MSADGEEMVTGTQVSYIGKDCTMIPSFLAKKYGHRAKRLDLSFNLLSSFTNEILMMSQSNPLMSRSYSCISKQSTRRSQ
ncbi:leucine-rich melanocyte differentiation-associated protein-like isoform X3 [Hyla sarda]|uniref:leucine-rich melanocyte differentiation-associated protein-like isoform X3 n=1 Tax=Hyla sarda TaxID=327740 RepID=UPI0024C295A7|nr:leucine-rich melanocyte differentiation-associated protein-like isoform X3 [Hyla sarda]